MHWAPGASPPDVVVPDDVPPQVPFTQKRLAQHWTSLAHAPPVLRQQLRAPSAAMPLLAHTTDPPLWLHSLVDVHSAPSARPPVLPPPPPHVPLRQTAPPQQ